MSVAVSLSPIHAADEAPLAEITETQTTMASDTLNHSYSSPSSPRHRVSFDKVATSPTQASHSPTTSPLLKRKIVDDDIEEGHALKHSKLVVDDAGTHTVVRDWVDDAIVHEHQPHASPSHAPISVAGESKSPSKDRLNGPHSEGDA